MREIALLLALLVLVLSDEVQAVDLEPVVEQVGLIVWRGEPGEGVVELLSGETVLSLSGETTVAVDALTVVVQSDGTVLITGDPLGPTSLTVRTSKTTLELTDRVRVTTGDREILDASRGNRFLRRVLPRVALPVDDAHITLMRLYGAMFLTQGQPPGVIRFSDETEVEAFWADLTTDTTTFGERSITLQSDAINALNRAREILAADGIVLRLANRHSGARGYRVTVPIWRSRLLPGLAHWQEQGRLSAARAHRILMLPMPEQLEAVLALEARRMFCNTQFNRPILTSVAAPGTSQHHSLLAVDLLPFHRSRVTQVLADHGWHRTVWADKRHFTYLGWTGAELADLGLVERAWDQHTYWVPAL